MPFTQMMTTAGRQFNDWAADYRLFEKERFDPDEIFSVARQEVEKRIGTDLPFVVSMDDSMITKRGRKVYGAGWRRDPMGRPFHVNFIWGQRFLQISALLPDGDAPCGARAIPIDFTHCPKPQKPSRKASKKMERVSGSVEVIKYLPSRIRGFEEITNGNGQRRWAISKAINHCC